MRSIIALSTIILLVFASCNFGGEDLSDKVAKGGAKYGGVFKFMSSEKISSLLPMSSASIYTQRVGSQVFETILNLDPATEKIVPGLAKSYSINEDATQFTFQIRRGVYFHDDECFNGGKGRELDANDVKSTLDMACSKSVNNEIFWLLLSKIKGAKNYYDQSKVNISKGGVSGIKVIDNFTLRIDLEYSFVGFDKLLAHRSLGIFPREAFQEYGAEIGKHPVGTGPFKLESWTDDKIVLTRNENYWKSDKYGNKLPFLAGIEVTYSKDKKSELLAFRKKEIDLVLQIPAEEIDNAIGSLSDAQAGKNVKHKIDSRPSLSTAYFGFAGETKPFNDVNVRKAFNLALDREYLINNKLQGEGYPCLHGFVPSMPDYNTAEVIGYTFNKAQAQELLLKAGYPNGKGFPKIILYVNTKAGSITHKVAIAVQEQLKKNLNIFIAIKLCSIKERDEAIKNGKAKFWRGGWIADYPDPENFLSLFYGKNIDKNSVISNPFKYNNSDFDTYLETAMREKNPSTRSDLFEQCDQQIIDDAVVMPIYHAEFMTMVNNKIKNFHANSTEIIDFSSIFIRDTDQE
jgi:oligopeptide transport system substrate-binding protein